MSIHKSDIKKITIQRLHEMKRQGEKMSMLTAYDYTMARILDEAGVEILLVGDSAANVMAGYETTLPISLDHMIYYGASVARACKRAMVIVDLPFGTYQGDPETAIRSAVRVMKETSSHGIKIEGGAEIEESVKKILSAGIPVMGHLGLTPQSINKFGTFSVRAKEEAEANKLISDAKLLEELGCFAIVLEKVPATLAKTVAEQLTIPIIGIGAGAGVDGQVLVVQDMMGMNKDFKPKFLRRYADLQTIMTEAAANYINDVKSGDFPNQDESY
ncbi:3-methyl-2-oxobutanoate hydroxymethyltransferase [Fulvivirga sediminis]|uniref:3-methyl-2-oxobutanoate hydroxymethyltransferase n=1 Tax=Fulvivirga sediminis TaxID=2803949 RepID=A0A937F6Q2_9BACT|nr:3-methyl-2-oxobutanoate hydroxymethyltransferase [Fulvivirga sediminis]MBL3654993.1 3-methyl-2-oxobutanoate hydroxymethyltransferase [Fulvivirga sediminis]